MMSKHVGFLFLLFAILLAGFLAWIPGQTSQRTPGPDTLDVSVDPERSLSNSNVVEPEIAEEKKTPPVKSTRDIREWQK